MTHKDIYTKFMIEYDKANVTSSYPSLTEYEIATVLDKAYNALIAQKVTGNNVRRVGFEGDNKAIADITPLINRSTCELSDGIGSGLNAARATLPKNMLYYVSGMLNAPCTEQPMDKKMTRPLPIKLVTHEVADKFLISPYNLPWIKTPVCFIEDNYIYVIYDIINKPNISPNHPLVLTYIKKPNTFVKDTQSFNIPDGKFATFFDYSDVLADNNIYDNTSTPGNMKYSERYNFECNDTVAEELISLAVAFALENVESQRLNSKINMRGLEA